MKVALNFNKGFPALKEGFQVLGCEVVENAWNASALQGVDACIIELYEGVRQPWRTLRLKMALRRMGAPLIGVDRDAPWHKGIRLRKLWFFDALGLLDIYATHSLQNVRQFASNIIYLPNAVWSSQYNLKEASLEAMRRPDWYRHDVSFLGNLDAVRYREHRQRVEFLEALETRLKPLGVNCYFHDSSGMTAEDQVEVIQHSRISLNYGAACDNGPEKSWGLPERCYGVPACGGFLLSDERRHAGEDFAPNKEWASFGDLDECVAKICYFLEHFDQARDIAEAAYHRVMLDHTYKQRAERLVAEVRAWRGDARSY